MKKTLLIIVCMLLFTTITPDAKAQEWNAGLDIWSSYLWRGAKFGTGAAFQPGVEFSAGGFAVGAWGSYSTGADEAAEADLYASYGFDLGENTSLSFTVTDYFFPGTSAAPSSWTSAESHYIEPMVSLGLGSFTLSAAYMEGLGDSKINTTSDVYMEASYAFSAFDIILAGGDGQYTKDGDFGICQIGIGTSKEIKVTDTFSIPLSGAIVLNPSTEGFHVAVGISL
jgi:uncharacterized protein (TIGR02001 family)